MALEVGGEAVCAHEGREGDGVAAVALEGFDGVLFGGAADVATFAVQDDGHMGRGAADVLHQALKLLFGAGGGKVGDLRFVGECQVGSGINDCRAKVVDFARVALIRLGQAGDVGV